LEAALGYGLDYLPYSCLQGWCVSCAGRLLSGTVDQSASLRFFDADSDEKFDLLCTARPTSDVRIQTHQKETMRQHRIERKLPVPLAEVEALPFLRTIVRGPLWEEFEAFCRSSLPLEVCFCHLERAFVPKGQVGRHFRSISRNGMVLMLSPRPTYELDDQQLHLRLLIWHRSHLPREPATPWGILLFARASKATDGPKSERSIFVVALEDSHDATAALSAELGGARVLNFFPREIPTHRHT
jgi:ferredoxin